LNRKDPTFSEDFPWIWQRCDLPNNWEPQDLVEGSDWRIFDFPEFSAVGYIDLLYAFQRDQCPDFNLNESFELFDLQRLKEDCYEHFLIVVQEKSYYKFDIKKIEDRLKENKH
jgi:hypothetical protein